MFLRSGDRWPRGQGPVQAFCGEDERLAVLAAHGTDALVDDPELQRIVEFAAKICNTPLALITMVERDRQHFLARTGIEARETPRPTSFCAHAMLGGAPLVVTDARHDERFADNPLVTADPHIRFYAGHPLISSEGAPLGALCVIDTAPRETGLTPLQREGLTVLADSVMRILSQQRLDERALHAVEQREARLKQMIDSVPGIAWSADDGGKLDYVNARWSEVTGAPLPTSAQEWAELIHPDDREDSLTRWIGAMQAGLPHEDEIRMRHADGEYRWVLSRAVPVIEAGSKGPRWFGTVIDVDRARRLSEARDLLASELSHRIKNIFAVVSGLIAIHSRGKPEATTFAKELTDAIRALATAHDYVRPGDGKRGESLTGLLEDLLAPYRGNDGDQRIAISGETVPIGARAATPLALIFHELATNSAKYGALASPDGHVSVAVESPCQGTDHFCVVWQERGIDRPVAESEHEGFGSRLLRMSVEGQLGGSFERVFSPEGLDIKLTLPQARLVD